ncbi:MAG: LysM peptidoglycan-binding domain-containing protein [Anaerolineae bacterium]|nr:LysM peptidoglycan-binding domain-containing protein [Anaerolineae bacterium]
MRNKRHVWVIGLLLAALLIGGMWVSNQRVAIAQTNLLTNGSLERPYYGTTSSTTTAPEGWDLWYSGEEPEAFPHTDQVQVRDGEVSWNIKKGYVAITAAGYQRVGGLTEGDAVKLTAYGWVYTCNDTKNSCIIEEPPYRESQKASQTTLKVGIDPTGGTNPGSDQVVWSAVARPYDEWAEMSVTAAAESDTVTVYLYVTQGRGLALNNIYWDQASLVRTDEEPENAPPATATPYEVPFVAPQGVRPDGSIVHVVQEGDTLSSIAFAYNKDYGVTIESIAAINENIKTNTRFLIIGQEILILPPGSVDPVTGQLIPPEQQAQNIAATQTAAAPPPAPIEVVAPAPEAGGEATEEAQPGPEGEATAEAEAAEEPTPEATEEPGAEPEATAEVPEEAAEEAAPEPPAAEEPQAVAEADTGTDGQPSVLTATSGTLCVTIYEDQNTNMARDSGEAALTGSQVVLAQAGSADSEYAYDDPNGPLCLDLLPGRYEVRVGLPEGYGATTADAANVSLVSGHQVSVSFGGALGFAAPAAPEEAAEADETGEVIESGAVAPVMVEVEVDSEKDDKSALDKLYDNAGLLVLGFAGVIVVSSTMLVIAVRRFWR